jgi:WD40 repeat protein/serine/threonine protein kinase
MKDFIGHQIDQYQILEQVGMGGMAVVFKAYDTRLDRLVAIKLIRADEIPGSQQERLLLRFRREAKAHARLNHPNIVPAFDYGEIENIPYLVLAYMPGGTLKDRIQGVMPVKQALQMIAPIADAIAYAHRMDILHRDIKPSNIVFNEDGQPLLTDFGIAKLLETNEATLTGTGFGVGTPEYMAPEQWQGSALPATDQYALGVILFELVTGQKPYTAETPLGVALKQLNEPLPRPRDLNPDIPEALEKVFFKVLARDPDDRLEDMAKMKQLLLDLIYDDVDEELEAILPVDEPVKILPTGTLLFEPETVDELIGLQQSEKVAAVSESGDVDIGSPSSTPLSNSAESNAEKPGLIDVIVMETPPNPIADDILDQNQSVATSRRRSVPVWLLGIIGFVIVAGLLVGAGRTLVRESPPDPAEPVLAAADVREFGFAPSVDSTVRPEMSLTSTTALTSTPEASPTNTQEIQESTALLTPTLVVSKNYPAIQPSNVALLKEVERFGLGFSGDLACSPDGTVLAVSGRNGIYLYTTPDLDTKGFIETGSLILSVVYSPNGNLLAAGGWDGSVHLFDVGSDMLLDTLNSHTGEVNSMAFSPDGEYLISGGSDGTVRLWNVDSRVLLRTFEGHTSKVNAVAFSVDGKTFASGSDDRSIRLWDIDGGDSKTTIAGHTNSVTTVAFSPDGTRLISGSSDGMLILWTVDRGLRLHGFEVPFSFGVRSAVFSPDGKRILSSSHSNLYLWYVSSGALLSTIGVHGSYRAAVSPDGSWLAAVTDDTLHLLDAEIGAPLQRREEKGSYYSSDVIVSPDGALLAIESFDRTLTLWELGGEFVQVRTSENQMLVGPIAFSPDGSKYATSDDDHTLHVWDLKKGIVLQKISGHTGRISNLSFSPDGSLLASTGVNRSIELWEIESGVLLHTLEGHSGAVSLLAFSPSGEWLASHDSEGYYLWDVESGTLLKSITESNFGRSISNMAITPNGLLMAFGGSGRFNLWDLQTGEMHRRLYWNTDSVTGMALSHDGKILASVGRDRVIRLWDPESFTQNRSLEGNLRPNNIAFSPDGTLLALGGGWNDLIHLWDVMSGELLSTKISNYLLSFSPDGRLLITEVSNGIISLWAVSEE